MRFLKITDNSTNEIEKNHRGKISPIDLAKQRKQYDEGIEDKEMLH